MNSLSFVLSDTGETVELEIRRNGNEPVRYKNVSPTGVRVREPLPEKEPFLAMLRDHAEHGLCGGTLEGCLAFYIQARYRAMAEQVTEIEKAIKRLEKQQQSIELARQWLAEARNAI